MTAAVLVKPQDQVGFHIQGQRAAERFIEGLHRFLCTGSELAELLAQGAAMPREKREPWQRGFAGALQKHCQRVSLAP